MCFSFNADAPVVLSEQNSSMPTPMTDFLFAGVWVYVWDFSLSRIGNGRPTAFVTAVMLTSS